MIPCQTCPKLNSADCPHGCKDFEKWAIEEMIPKLEGIENVNDKN